MKIGIFSDIHGNIYAFEKIWKALEKELCDQYFFLGDICGYYYYQNEIIEILRSIKNLISIRGNHDDIFLKILDREREEKEYTKKYGNSFAFFKKTIKEESLNFLKKLPETHFVEKYKMALFHGNPWDHLNGYIYPTDSIERFQELPYKIVLLGHTHYPMNRVIKNVRIINPGSCGQPRDYNQPSYSIVDLESQKVQLKRVSYNYNLMIQDVINHNENNRYLIDILKRGKL